MHDDVDTDAIFLIILNWVEIKYSFALSASSYDFFQLIPYFTITFNTIINIKVINKITLDLVLIILALNTLYKRCSPMKAEIYSNLTS